MTTTRADANYYSATTSSVKSNATNADVSASSDVIAGDLTLNNNVVTLPLLGAATWTIVSSARTIQTLYCASQETSLEGRVIIGSGQSCQLKIALAQGEETATWQITRAR